MDADLRQLLLDKRGDLLVRAYGIIDNDRAGEAVGESGLLEQRLGFGRVVWVRLDRRVKAEHRRERLARCLAETEQDILDDRILVDSVVERLPHELVVKRRALQPRVQADKV